MRELTDHMVNPTNEKLKIEVVDLPGAGGASHAYRITGFNLGRNPSEDITMPALYNTLVFQHGPIDEVGVNGITHEALLAILVDRLRFFQAGPYKCRENAIALTKLEEAGLWLMKRTVNRIVRGVEGTHKV